MARYFIIRDMTESFFDLKYELKRGNPENSYTQAVPEGSFVSLFFAKRAARKLMKLKQRHVLVWDSEKDK